MAADLSSLSKKVYSAFPYTRFGSNRDAFCYRRVSAPLQAHKVSRRNQGPYFNRPSSLAAFFFLFHPQLTILGSLSKHLATYYIIGGVPYYIIGPIAIGPIAAPIITWPDLAGPSLAVLSPTAGHPGLPTAVLGHPRGRPPVLRRRHGPGKPAQWNP